MSWATSSPSAVPDDRTRPLGARTRPLLRTGRKSTIVTDDRQVRARSLAETQLQVQFTILGGLDTQALGILGVNVALAALAVAAQSVLESFWWLSVLGFAASGVACLVALFGSSDPVGPSVETVLEMGDGREAGDDANRYVAEELGATIELNNLHVARESTIVGAAVGLLAVALAAVSGTVIS